MTRIPCKPTRFRAWLLGLFALPLLLGAAFASDQGPGKPESAPRFEKDILPILTAKCLQCHSAGGMGGLDLRALPGILKGGSQGPALIKGSAAKSLLFQRVANKSMPPGDNKLTDAEIQTVRAWIEAGAPTVNPETASSDPARNHWAFRAPVRPKIPTVQHRAWVRTPIDAFVLAKLEQKHILPPPNAAKRNLLRRVYLDLIGLPPTPQEQRDFLSDTSPNAYEKVVDDLLARTQYGERWARHWLDVARYAETNGYERDNAKPSAWRYRDYVIGAFNKDKPYDRFVTEQIAGDEMEGTCAESQIAMAFLRLGTWDDEPADPKIDRCDQMDDVVGTTATAFLGLTLRCARCHNHKFEPFTQKDYYSALAIFDPLQRPRDGQTEIAPLAGTEAELAAYHDAMAKADAEVARLQAQTETLKQTTRETLLDEKRTTLSPEAVAAFGMAPDKRNDAQKKLVEKFHEASEKEIVAALSSQGDHPLDLLKKQIEAVNAARPKEPPRAYAWKEDPKPPITHLLYRGDPNRPGEERLPAIPAVLVHAQPGAPTPLAHSSGRRLWLAHWLTRPDNPLTARVIVNRLWQHHFGAGIVATANDFGVMGARPTHPALLDWLACELVHPSDGGVPWSLKRIQRLIVLSNTYRETTALAPDAQKRDPENVLYSRWKERRLEAECIRDSILAVSGQINLESGGPSITPPLPQEVLQGQSRPGDGWGKSDARQSDRRSIYIFVKRSLAVPELETLDAPDTTSSCERRAISTVAPQALTFLNGDFTRQQAHLFAERLQKEAGDDPKSQIAHAFELAFCRLPRPEETRASLDFLASQQRQIETDAQAANKPISDARRKALDAFCLVLLNANEFFYTD